MEANNFIAKLKADGSKNDECNLDNVYKQYRSLLMKIPSKDRGVFSLNVLCILCRNLEKIPSWKEKIDNKSLLLLSIDCVRETRGIDRSNRVKTLACIYHLHKHVIRQLTPLPPELVLKISVMPFELDAKDLLSEYSKTYWNIIVDRITYLEKMKGKISITKLLPKITEDIIKVIEIYDTVQFSMNFLPFLLRKLLYLYTDKCSIELNKVYIKIFESIAKKDDLKTFKKLQHKELLDLYAKFNDCLYIVTENNNKLDFKDFPLDSIIRTILNVIGHSPDVFHCLQTFYLNSICCIFKDKLNFSYVETIFNNMMNSFITTERLGYEKAMYITYPFLSQFLKLYIETITQYKINKDVQLKILQMMYMLMKQLKRSEQLLKCENCPVKSGLHDALRLSFQAKSVITTSIEQNVDMNDLLPIFYSIVKDQYSILTILGQKGCVNYIKCFRKFQSDVHNTAILLNKAEMYTYARKLFDVYIKNEIVHFKCEIEMRNIARALYNKSICELDCKLFEDALIDAFLSLIFAQDLNADKYMSLAMDIKAKAHKSIEETESKDSLQLMTVTEACNIALERGMYGNLKPFFTALKFSDFSKHEFSMYAKLWPSIVPIAGVWRSILDMYKGNYETWMTVEKGGEILMTLVQIVLETPSIVRTVQSEHFSKVVLELIDILEKETSIDFKVAFASLLFLKSEFEFADAGVKYGWKVAEQNINPDEFKAIRTYQQEYACLRSAMDAVEIWIGLVNNLKNAKKTAWLSHALHLAEIYVQQFLRLEYLAYGLQLAHVCCRIADFIGDQVSFVRNAGTILYFMDKSTEEVALLVEQAGQRYKALVKDETTLEPAIIFICDCAIYYSKCNLRSASAKLVLHAQAQILAAQESTPNLNLDLAIGRLLEAQMRLCKETGPTALTTVNMVQRHYLLICNNATDWTSRRLRSLTLKHHTALASLKAVQLCRALVVWRRARSAAGAVLPSAGAHAQAQLFATITNTWKVDDTQTEIDNRLKYIIGLQPTNDTQPDLTKKTVDVLFTPRAEIETMRDSMLLKKTQASPSLPCNSVQAFNIPGFLQHDNRCRCYACQTPSCLAMTCRTFCLEASMYFRAKEHEIADNYFAGVFKILNISEGRLRNIVDVYSNKFDRYIVDLVEKVLFDELKSVKLEALLDASFFELAQRRHNIVDSYIVNIHEILQELDTVDEYLTNNISNLLTASAHIRKVVKTPVELGIEVDFESLTLSPVKIVEVLTTPDNKRVPVNIKIDKVVYKDEDIPKKRRIVTKFSLDDESDEKEVKENIKDDFKIPNLVVHKHVLEAATPVLKTRSKLQILITQPSQDTPINNLKVANSKSDVTPRPSRSRAAKSQAETSKVEFFTPKQSPEEFFTPMTSIKTYAKKDLRGHIVKNLEKDFVDKENIKEVRSRKKALQRATSPGKLATEQRRGRRPKINADD